MLYHLLAYEESVTAGQSNVDLDLVPDTVFTGRNNHAIFYEKYQLLAAYAHGTSITASRISSPSLDAPSIHHIWPVSRNTNIPSRPVMADYRRNPIFLPTEEEIRVETSNDLGAGNEQHHVILFLAPPGWTPNPVRGKPRSLGGTDLVVARFTATITVNNNVWSDDAALTFDENLKGGWYAMLRSAVQGTGSLAHRYVFRQVRSGQKRPLRPGALSSQAIGDTPEEIHWGGGFGVMGYFEAHDPPTIQSLSLTGGGASLEGRLLLAYLGDTPPAGII